MSDSLREAIDLARSGSVGAARRHLVDLLRDNPTNIRGWALLARLVDNPAQKRDLLHRMLALPDERNLHAWAQGELAALDAPPEAAEDEDETRPLPDVMGPPDTEPIIEPSPPSPPADETQPISPTERLEREELRARLAEIDDSLLRAEQETPAEEPPPKEPLTPTPVAAAVAEEPPQRRPTPSRRVSPAAALLIGVVAILVLLVGVTVLFGRQNPEAVSGLPFFPTVTPTATVEPTATPAPPTATPTTAPTSTPAPTITPSPMPTATPLPTIDPIIPEEGVQTLSGPGEGFGRPVQMAGSTLAVGVAGEEGVLESVVIYGVTGVAIQQTSVPANGTTFGLDADRLAVDAGDEVVVYRGDAGAWDEETRLAPSEPRLDLDFGASIAVSGDTVVVGAPNPLDESAGLGAAYVFTRDEETEAWAETAVLTSGTEDPFDGFGDAVAIHGDLIAVGAFFTVTPSGEGSGAVHVFERDDEGTWERTGFLFDPQGLLGDDFGDAVAVHERTIAVAAPRAGSDDGGMVMIFEDVRGRGDWGAIEPVTLAAPNVADPTGYGASIALAEDILAVSGPADPRSVIIYVRRSARWQLASALVPPDSPLAGPVAGGAAGSVAVTAERVAATTETGIVIIDLE